MSWKEAALAFHTTWENVFRAVKYAVEWGLVHRDESGIKAIVDGQANCSIQTMLKSRRPRI